MDMNFVVIYHEDVVEYDIPKLSHPIRERIRLAIETKLTASPELFGKPLRRSLKGYRKLRVGDYRVIFRIEKYKIKIFMIAHRSFVYQRMAKRY